MMEHMTCDIEIRWHLLKINTNYLCAKKKFPKFDFTHVEHHHNNVCMDVGNNAICTFGIISPNSIHFIFFVVVVSFTLTSCPNFVIFFFSIHLWLSFNFLTSHLISSTNMMSKIEINPSHGLLFYK